MLDLPANCNRLYAIGESDNGGTNWLFRPPAIRATANYLMWLDMDDAAPSNRLYRVLDRGL